MISWDQIDERLLMIGRSRAWLASMTERSEGAIRAALAPRSKPKNRSALLQKALSDAIEAEEARQAAADAESGLPPGYSKIFLTDEELEVAEQAAKLAGYPSIAAFCRAVIQAEARRLLAAEQETAAARARPATALIPATTS